MDKIKALLLPLALIFAAIAIFEFGARYGASNTRAVALTGQLNNFVNLYRQVAPHADAPSRANLEAVIDNHIMTAALQRSAWYLRFQREPKHSLEQALSTALLLRSDALDQRLGQLEQATPAGDPQLSPARLAEIRHALDRARADLIATPAAAEL